MATRDGALVGMGPPRAPAPLAPPCIRPVVAAVKRGAIVDLEEPTEQYILATRLCKFKEEINQVTEDLIQRAKQTDLGR